MYSKKSKPGEPLSSFAAPPHKDNGLILYLTPFAQHPLQLTDRYGFKIDTSSLGEDSVLIMFGRALSGWLLWGPSEQFHAPTHSVLTMPETVQSRTVMARMKMLPDNALSQRGEYFGDFFTNSLEKNNHAGEKRRGLHTNNNHTQGDCAPPVLHGLVCRRLSAALGRPTAGWTACLCLTSAPW